MDGDDLEARLEAVERALADGDTDLTAVAETAERERELEELRERVDDLESEVTDLAASVQAVRGYVGNVRTVNRDVERRADAALAKVEELERRGTESADRHWSEREARASPDDGDPGEQPMRGRRTDGQSGSDGGESGRAESPGDIARRITGSDRSQRDRRPPGSEGGRDGGEHHTDADRRPHWRNGGGPTTESGEHDDEDGFLSGLRDAL